MNSIWQISLGLPIKLWVSLGDVEISIDGNRCQQIQISLFIGSNASPFNPIHIPVHKFDIKWDVEPAGHHRLIGNFLLSFCLTSSEGHDSEFDGTRCQTDRFMEPRLAFLTLHSGTASLFGASASHLGIYIILLVFTNSGIPVVSLHYSSLFRVHTDLAYASPK